MTPPQIYEGTAEEIADKIKNSRLAGKLKAIITSDEDEIIVKNGTSGTLDIALASLLEEAERVIPETPVPLTDPGEKAFGEIMDEKYRKMGFKL